jgi:HlyD family secretion protein
MSVDNSALPLRPGMTVTAEITVQHKDDVLLVPNAALRFIPPAAAAPAAATGTSLASRLMWRPPPIEKRVPDDASSTTRVWVLHGNEAQPVAVGLGATDGVRTEITSGALSPGAEVIVGVRSSAP